MKIPIANGLLLEALEAKLSTFPDPTCSPLPTDKWVARSCLQKAIRRGETELAYSALATLIREDRYGVWRHLIVIAFEDVGAANFIAVAQLVAASADLKWRKSVGGTWRVAALLVSELASGPHCQATCDLLLRARNSQASQLHRSTLARLDTDRLAATVFDRDLDCEKRAVAILAMTGEYGGKPYPALALSALDNQPYSTALVELCGIAWTKTRDPMTLLFPIIWEKFLRSDEAEVLIDDELPAVSEATHGVPGYALDQFTRVGNRAARMVLANQGGLQEALSRAGIAKVSQPRALGDLIFILEGGLLRRRLVWRLGDELRQPWRCLPIVSKVGSDLEGLLERVSRLSNDISDCRQKAFADYMMEG